MTLPSFDEITRQLDIPRCRGILPNGQYCQLDHVGGVVHPDQGRHWRVHWSDDRRVTRASIRRYLALAAWAKVAAEASVDPVWAIQYEALRLIPILARQIHVQLPHAMGDLDRSILRSLLINQPPSEKRTEALAWLAAQRQKSGGARRAAP